MDDRISAKKRSWSGSVPRGNNGMDNDQEEAQAMIPKESEAEGAIHADFDSHSISDLEMDAIASDEDDEDDDGRDREGGEDTGLTSGKRRSRTSRTMRRRTSSNGGLITQVNDANTLSGNGDVDPSKATSAQATEAEKKKLVSATMLKQTLTNVLLIALWYSFSISISVYNKWMFSKDNLNFPYPLFTTSIHMLVQFSLASSVLFFMPQFRPSAGEVKLDNKAAYTQLSNSAEEARAIERAEERAAGGGDSSAGGAAASSEPPPEPVKQMPLMTKTFYFTRIAPCGTATALDIGLGNFSLRFISLTFFTMCKSSVLGFVLLCAFLFGLETPTWRLCGIILLMTVGVIMMVAGEAAFNTAGFLLVMSASMCSGFRWSLTQILLLRNRATSNPFSATFFLTPVMFLALFLLALPVEGITNVVAGIQDLSQSEGGFVSILILLFPGFLAFLMVSAEFALLKRTSVVTLSVCGIFKEVLTISAAGIIFGDELTPINVSGLFVTIASIAAYNWLKYTNMRRAAEEKIKDALLHEGAGSGARAGAANGGIDGSSAAAGLAEGRKSLDDAEATSSLRRESDAVVRGSTDALMRDSLRLTTGNGHAQQNGKSREVTLSPVKRPEDIE